MSNPPVPAASGVSSTWWADAVVYQIYPRSFADGNGDGMGDLRGVMDRLPYLEQLGVDAIWLSPFYKSPQADGGYDGAYYRQVDPLFGSLADFDPMTWPECRGAGCGRGRIFWDGYPELSLKYRRTAVNCDEPTRLMRVVHYVGKCDRLSIGLQI